MADKESLSSIKVVDATRLKNERLRSVAADCVILTKNGQLLLQQRPPDWRGAENCLTTFGGHIEDGEQPAQALVRELAEELGAQVNATELVELGAVTEAETNHTEIVHTYFWRDKNGTITGCYEGEAVYYDRIDGALAHPKIMDYVRWQLKECIIRGLIK